MKRPRTLLVGGAQYRIRAHPGRARDLYGETDHRARTIALARGLKPPVAARTLMHEALHIAYDEAGLAADPVLAKLEERIVSALEAPLAALVADNPAFTDFLRKALKR